jgi:CO/xanthine dehydrogenase FAD-binding subunit
VTYNSPTDLAAALALAATAHHTVIAGGTDVYPACQQGRPPASLLDVTRVAELTHIQTTPEYIRVGAAVTWSQIIKADLPRAFDALKQSAREVGSVQIQNAGTISGNLCNASPAADGVPPLLTLAASVEVASQARGPRIIPLADFITGVRTITLQPDELLTAILVPHPEKTARSAFEKLGSRKYLVISITMTAAQITCDDIGRITQARVAVGACSAVAQRLPDLEARLIGMLPTDIVIEPNLLSALSPIDDVRGSAEFRLDVVAEQCARVIKKAAIA